MSSHNPSSAAAAAASVRTPGHDGSRATHPHASPALRALVLAVATGILLVSVLEGRVGAGSGDGFDAERAGTGDDLDAVALLERSVVAGRTLPFTGTLAISARGSRGIGWFDSDRTSELALVTATNVPGQGIDLQTQTEGGSEAVFVAVGDASPIQLERSAVAVLDRAFDLLVGGHDTVAGRPVRVVDARRFDGSLAGRFWVDRQTDLLLRREVYDSTGEVVRSSEFVDVRLDPLAAAFRPLAANLPAADGERVAEDDYAGLAADGWACCPAELAGVLELREARRVAEAAGVADVPTVQLVYSDGLTTASVFQQRGSLAPSALAGFESRPYGDDVIHVREGLVTYAVWSTGGMIYTVACDTPYGLAAAVAGFPHRATASNDGNTNLPARLDRGVSRMVSWLNPFE